MIEHAHVVIYEATKEYQAILSTGRLQGSTFRILNVQDLKKDYPNPVGREVEVAFDQCNSYCVYLPETILKEKANSPTGVSQKKYGKVCLRFKTPDVVSYACENEIEMHGSEESEEKCEKIKEVAQKFIEWGENIRIELDLDEGTAKVLKVKE
jgi:hypothetical protein